MIYVSQLLPCLTLLCPIGISFIVIFLLNILLNRTKYLTLLRSVQTSEYATRTFCATLVLDTNTTKDRGGGGGGELATVFLSGDI